ncbi:hypothetical protein IE81DRAFT_232251 [Ceraceosorus guamensis]|uniref:Uncharacterized protein n=1 Tax=Ceraceosorus guamensis TaxID=1522189 RepID=A0A316VSW2_9BASI|nr:hypothetical protein IE81DRAFT_232251 [Ceraceosorus guamensis]PWN40314.1 hypothetical protein IE81DRAFT_232251 [Ceraceosorus guamensis]
MSVRPTCSGRAGSSAKRALLLVLICSSLLVGAASCTRTFAARRLDRRSSSSTETSGISTDHRSGENSQGRRVRARWRGHYPSGSETGSDGEGASSSRSDLSTEPHLSASSGSDHGRAVSPSDYLPPQDLRLLPPPLEHVPSGLSSTLISGARIHGEESPPSLHSASSNAWATPLEVGGPHTPDFLPGHSTSSLQDSTSSIMPSRTSSSPARISTPERARILRSSSSPSLSTHRRGVAKHLVQTNPRWVLSSGSNAHLPVHQLVNRPAFTRHTRGAYFLSDAGAEARARDAIHGLHRAP